MTEIRSQTVFALVDCNNFYASCERVFDPRLQNVPIVILSGNDGCIIARSNEAKALGIAMGAPYHEYATLIRKHRVRVFSSNFTLYGDMSRRVMAVLEELSPDIEYYSVDEAFLSLHTLPLQNHSDYARMIRDRVLQWVGLPVSVGIAPTKTLAKLANLFAKKDPRYHGVCDFTTFENLDEAFKMTPVDDVWGIGWRTTKLLKRYAVQTVWDLKNKPDAWVRKNLTVSGLKLVWELRGISCLNLEDAEEPRRSVISSRSFGKPVEKLSDLKESVATYVSRAAEKLRSQNLAASFLQVSLETNRFRKDLPQHRQSAGLVLDPPTAYTGELIRHAESLIEKIHKAGYRYKKTSVFLADLVPEKKRQATLFKTQAELEKENQLMRVLDKLNAKHGARTLHYAATGIAQAWRVKSDHKSQNFTTDWKELPLVKA
jgi:DNA polymerase V